MKILTSLQTFALLFLILTFLACKPEKKQGTTPTNIIDLVVAPLTLTNLPPPTNDLPKEITELINRAFNIGVKTGWNCSQKGGAPEDLDKIMKAFEDNDLDAIAKWFN